MANSKQSSKSSLHSVVVLDDIMKSITTSVERIYAGDFERWDYV